MKMSKRKVSNLKKYTGKFNRNVNSTNMINGLHSKRGGVKL